jgi:signal transduction histidine kinase
MSIEDNSLPLTRSAPDRVTQSLSIIRQRLRLLKWVVPIGLFLIVAIYEMGPSRWIHNSVGDTYYFLAGILVYGTVGPVLAFVLLDFLGRWLEERETSDLQAQVLARARQHALLSQQLSDDVLQSLFAVSTLLASLDATESGLSTQAHARLRDAQSALNLSVQQLRAYLLKNPNGDKG